MRKILYVAISFLFLGFAYSSDINPKVDADPSIQKMIEDLKPGYGLLLPNCKVVGELSKVMLSYNMDKTGPCGRDYCTRVAWVPERKRYVYFGANHGQPHRLNDVWEYDLPANTWICLYPADGNFDVNYNWNENVVVKDGIPQTKFGTPAMMAHTWGAITYDMSAHKVLFMSFWAGVPKKMFYKGWRQPIHMPPLWTFDPVKKQWSPMPNTKSKPPTCTFATALEYIPDLNKTLYVAPGAGTWLYNITSNSWQKLNAGPTPPTESVYCYDSKNKVVVSFTGPGGPYSKNRTGTFLFDIKTLKWTEYKIDTPTGVDFRSVFGFDPKSGKCYLYGISSGTDAVWAFDASTKTWEKQVIMGDKGPNYEKIMGGFDPARQVLVAHLKGKTWIYRPAEVTSLQNTKK